LALPARPRCSEWRTGRSSDGREVKRLRLVPQRLLSATEDGLTPVPSGVAGVCMLGPSALARLANLERSAQALDFAALARRLAGDDGNRFEGPIAIHPTACVASSVIIGPVVVGADALITDSYIGPHTSIAERVRIEGAELERSIVLADPRADRLGSE
jgi:hypothetical protein